MYGVVMRVRMRSSWIKVIIWRIFCLKDNFYDRVDVMFNFLYGIFVSL